MHRGYYKMWRRAEESLVFEHKDPYLWKLWSYCLFRASYVSREVAFGSDVVNMEPGQFITSRKSLSEKLHLSEQSIRTLLKILENSKNLTIKSTNRYSLITIINWDVYQSNGIDINQQINQQVTSSQPASNQQVTTLVTTLFPGNHPGYLDDFLHRLSTGKVKGFSSPFVLICLHLFILFRGCRTLST
jgi:hypothetical protein